MELAFERSTAYLWGFQSVRSTIFGQKRHFQVNGRDTLSLVSRCHGLQQEVLAHCFLVRIEVVAERNACQTKAFKTGHSLTLWIYPLQTKWAHTLIWWQDAMYARQQEFLAPCLPMRNEFPVDRISAQHWVLSGVRNITLVSTRCLQVNGSRPVYHVRKSLMLEASSLFSSENELTFQRNTAYFSFFESVKNIFCVQNSPIRVNGRSSVSPARKLLTLPATDFRTLLSRGNWVSFWKEHSLSLRVLKCKEHHLCVKEFNSMVEQALYVWKKTISGRIRRA
jgi:hypothetical protein